MSAERLSNIWSFGCEILRTICQPRTLSADIPASQKGTYLFYNPPINFHFTIKPLVNVVTKPVVIWWRMRVIDAREQSNLIGLINFISTVIGSNLTSCHMKLVLVTPLGSKTREFGAFCSYILTNCSKTWLERNVLGPVRTG